MENNAENNAPKERSILDTYEPTGAGFGITLTLAICSVMYIVSLFVK